jgi:hypothetical protein
MFRRHGFFRFLLIGFLIISFFGLIRGASYRSGWAQGFAAGQTADDAPPADEDAPPPAQAPNRGPHWGWGGPFSPFFWIVGGFFKFFLFLFFFGLIFKLFRFGRWRHWHHHNKEWKHHHHGHTPPWYDDSGEEPVMKA